MERDTLKKEERKTTQEIENFRIRARITDVSICNRVQEVKSLRHKAYH